MVMGTGSTRRYRESYSVAYNQDVFMPFLIDLFNKQIEILQSSGKNDRELQIKLQSKIFEIANTVKDFEGSVVALRRFGVVARSAKKKRPSLVGSVRVRIDRRNMAKSCRHCRRRMTN